MEKSKKAKPNPALFEKIEAKLSFVKIPGLIMILVKNEAKYLT